MLCLFDQNLCKSLDPHKVMAWLIANGWTREPPPQEHSDYVARLEHPERDCFMFSLRTGASDHGRRMAEVVLSLIQDRDDINIERLVAHINAGAPT